MNKLRHRVYKCNDVLFTFFYSDWPLNHNGGGNVKLVYTNNTNFFQSEHQQDKIPHRSTTHNINVKNTNHRNVIQSKHPKRYQHNPHETIPTRSTRYVKQHNPPETSNKVNTRNVNNTKRQKPKPSKLSKHEPPETLATSISRNVKQHKPPETANNTNHPKHQTK